MQREAWIDIKRGDLPGADLAFGLDEKDFDLSRTEVWIDGAAVDRDEQKRASLKAKAPLGGGQGTIVITTEAGKFIGVIHYDRTSGKIVRQEGAAQEPTVSSIVNDAVDKVVRAIKEIKPAGKEIDKIIETAADTIVKAIKGMKAQKGAEPEKPS